MSESIISDKDWLRQSFMLPRRAVTHQAEVREMAEAAEFKFTDTTLGGNFAINPPPQFTRFADLKVRSRFSASLGMGRYYSEALDDNGQYIHMRFGVPQFNSLSNFFFNFYNPSASFLARTGRAEPFFYRISRAAGQATGFIVTLPLQPLVWAGGVINFLRKKPVSRFYYLKPAMPLYWNAVSTMVNRIGVNMGVIGRDMSPSEAMMREDEAALGADHHRIFHERLGDIYREDGGIDIYAVATRAQRLAHKNRVALEQYLSTVESREDLHKKVLEFRDEVMLEDTDKPNMQDRIIQYHHSSAAAVKGQADGMREDAPNDATGDHFENLNTDDGFWEHSIAELEDGSQFVTFRVDDPGPVSESFSNTVGDSNIANKINSMSSSARSKRFDFAGGNIGSDPFSTAVEGMVGAVASFVQGALDAVKAGGVAALAGSAFVDIPKVWQSSTANLPRANYTIELRSPYGNPTSRFRNLIVPLSMLLAGALPLSTGKQSYTSPFLVELFSKGRNQIRLGMIDSLSITRGSGNVGWTRNGEPLGIDVTFSIVDLSSVMHMPVSANFNAIGATTMATAEMLGRGVGAAAGAAGMDTSGDAGAEVGAEVAAAVKSSNFDDDNAFSDYMSVLGSLSLSDQIYPVNKLRIRRAQTMADWNQWKSPAHHANWLMGNTPASILSVLTKQTSR